MPTRGRILLHPWICAVITLGAEITLAQLIMAADVPSSREERLLQHYTGTRGEDIEALNELGPNAIVEMARSLRNPDEPRRRLILPALVKAIESIPAPQAVIQDGKAAVYALLTADDVGLRGMAISMVGRLDGEEATGALFHLLESPEEQTRIQAITALQTYGRPDIWPMLQKALADRSGKLGPDQASRDGTLKFGRLAVDRLRLRSQGYTLESIAQQELTEYRQKASQELQSGLTRPGGGQPPPVGSTPSPELATPSVTEEINTVPAGKAAQVAEASPAHESRTSQKWKWGLGISALVLVMMLELIRRRVTRQS